MTKSQARADAQIASFPRRVLNAAGAFGGHGIAQHASRLAVRLAFALLVFAGCGYSAASQAQNYPSREIHLVIGFPAGSNADAQTRYFAEKLAMVSGATVVVDNKPGAAGNLAHAYVAKARPDGYTVYLVGGTSLASSLYLLKNPAVDPVKDLEPVGTVLKAPWVLLVDAKSPFKSLPALTSFLKEKGDKASFAAATTTGVVMGELYKSVADLKMVQVLYKNAGDAMNDMLGGNIDVTMADVGFTLGQTENGKVRALAVSTAVRSKVIPDVPTLAEGGIPGIDLTVWWETVVPAGTPQPVKDKLQGWFDQILRMPETAKFLATQGSEPFISSPAETTAYLNEEIKKWREYAQKAKLEPQ